MYALDACIRRLCMLLWSESVLVPASLQITFPAPHRPVTIEDDQLPWDRASARPPPRLTTPPLPPSRRAPTRRPPPGSGPAGYTLSAVSWITDLVPGLSVVSTATVAIWSKILDTKSKNQDRKQAIAMKQADQEHEIDLEFNKLFGQDKRDALQPLIAATWFVKRQALLSTASPSEMHYPRAIPIRALDQYVDKLGGENVLAKLLAYSSRPVEKAVNEMLSQRDKQWQIHSVALTELKEIGREWDQIRKRRVESATWRRNRHWCGKAQGTPDLGAMIRSCGWFSAR